MKILALIFLFGFNSCSPNSGYEITWRTYNLKGKVKMISDKFSQSNSIDSEAYKKKIVNIQNRIFNEKGILLKVEYFNSDSNLILEIKHVYSNDGNLIKSEIYKDGKINEIVDLVRLRKNIIESKTYNFESNKLNSISFNEYKNDLLIKQSTENTNDHIKQESFYYRDSSGLESKIVNTTIVRNHTYRDSIFINYEKFDQFGNWLIKKECRSNIQDNCRVITRRLTYYNK